MTLTFTFEAEGSRQNPSSRYSQRPRASPKKYFKALILRESFRRGGILRESEKGYFCLLKSDRGRTTLTLTFCPKVTEIIPHPGLDRGLGQGLRNIIKH